MVNYLDIILNKFIKKNKDKIININQSELIELYKKNNEKCYISKKLMTHIVDDKKRTDNIWNISIFLIDDKLNEININNIILVCNLFDTIKRGYNIKNYKEMLDIFNNINLY